jgi:hypothetical protein
MPYYKYKDFKQACGNDTYNVIPIDDVLRNAREKFNLNTKSQLLEFIHYDGLEDLKFVNTKDWENNPDPANTIKVYAYEFRTMGKLGYIAFMYNKNTQKWLIKSFHLSKNRNMAMFLAFEKAKRIKMEEGDE